MIHRKFVRLLIILFLLLSSVLTMMELKLRWENASLAGEDFTVYQTYFWLAVAIFSCTLGYVVFSWVFTRWREYKMLKNERLESELSVLKSKIDPHFFFNTLNNLYGLAREKSEDTPDVILKLSEIMRYVIYEGEKERVPLSEEVAYLEKYLDLHRIRYQKNVRLEFNATVEEGEVEIAPLLLVIFVENGVKHGLERVSEGAYLTADLVVSERHLTFEVKNKHTYSEPSTEGTGLKNVQRRLELLYPKKHKLSTRMLSDEFVVKLEIDLT